MNIYSTPIDDTFQLRMKLYDDFFRIFMDVANGGEHLAWDLLDKATPRLQKHLSRTHDGKLAVTKPPKGNKGLGERIHLQDR